MESKEEQAFQEILTTCTSPISQPSDSTPQPNPLGHIFSRIKYLIDSRSSLIPRLNNISIYKFIRHFLNDRDKEIRVSALRTLRYLALSEESMTTIKEAQVEHFIVRAFESEGRSQERIEACKLIKRWLEISPKNFPKGFINALIALSEIENDELRELAIEALRLLSISNTLLVAWSGGFRVLINCVLDLKCPQALSENIVLTFLYLLNEKKTRIFLRREKEIARLLAVFTDQDSGLRENELEAQIKLARRALVLMSRSWVGLIFLASGGLKEVIDNLRQPIKQLIKEGILDTITDMLNIPIESSAKSQNLLNNYLAMLLRALLHCNLYPALTQLSMDRSDRIAHRARKLLKLVTKSASDLLPEAPQFPLILNSNASGKAAEVVADIDSSARLQKESDNRNLVYSACEFVSYENMGGASSVNWVLSSIYKQHAMNMINDSIFTDLLNKSQIVREPAKWDWDVIYEIVAGPISTPERFQAALKFRFLKFLLGYFMPSRNLFPLLPWHTSNFIKARVGSLLIPLLLSQEDGIQLLTTTFSESFFVIRKSFMSELVDALDEEIKAMETNKSGIGRILSPEKVRGFMTREYFKWIGQFTMFRGGRKLIKTYGIDAKLMKLGGVEHLSPILLPHLDYREQMSRDFLSFAMQAKSVSVRKHAMEHLRVLFRAGIFDLSWAIRELVNQLYCPDQDTISSALSVIDELCQDKENLKTFIETGPQTLTRLGEEGNKCLIRFLSSSSGVSYLSHLDFIENELQKWHQRGNLDYVRTIEQRIEMGLSATKKTYSLTLPTPPAYLHSERLEAAWIRSLPFSLTVSINNSITKSFDPIIEVEDDDVYMTVKIEMENPSEALVNEEDSLNISLLLGNYFIDAKGQESLEPDWVNCNKEDRQRDHYGETLLVEKDGIIFKFDVIRPGRFMLNKISYRLLCVPRAAPTMLFPRHLYGELVKTKLGLKKLKDSRHIEELLAKLTSDGPIIEKRAALWALGHTGCTERGVTYLTSLRATGTMINIAEQSPVLSLRGTAFQAVSLLAKSQLGRSELAKHGWASPVSMQATIAMPLKAEAIFWLEDEEKTPFYSDKCLEAENVIDSIDLNEEEKEVLNHVIGLGSVVNRSESEQFLRNKRMQSPNIFQSIPLFHATMTIIAAYTFKMSARKLVHKLFERIYRSQENLKELDGLVSLV